MPASAWAMGYALLDFWKSNYSSRISIPLETLHQSEFSKIFMFGKDDLTDALQILQHENYLEIQGMNPNKQIVLLRNDPEYLLKKLYAAI